MSPTFRLMMASTDSRSVSLIAQINHNLKQYIPPFSSFSMTYVLVGLTSNNPAYWILAQYWGYCIFLFTRHTVVWKGIKFAIFSLFCAETDNSVVVQLLRGGRAVFRIWLLTFGGNISTCIQLRVQDMGSDGPFLASQIPIFTTGLQTSRTQQVAAL